MAFKRKPPTSNVRRVISLENNFRGVTTNKQGHLVQFESEQERKLILLLERDASVTNYTSQPQTFCFYNSEGRKRHYTPDFQVWRTNGQIEIHEVTVEKRRQEQASLGQREVLACALCERHGWQYIVHTDQTLPSGYEYANLDFLANFRGTTFALPEITAWWLEQLAGQGRAHPKTIIDQSAGCWPTGVLLNGLYHLLWHNAVQMEWQQPFIWHDGFHPAACVWLPEVSKTISASKLEELI